MAKDLAIVLSNGSVNSAVVTALAAQRFRPVMLYVESAVDPASRMRASYDMQVAHFKPYREHTISMPFLTTFLPAGSGNTNSSDPRATTPVSGHLIDLLPLVAAGLRYAVHHHANQMFVGLRIGANADDLAQAAEYIQIWNEMMQLPCARKELEISMPLLELEPWQVIDLGIQVAAPFERTWSCQEDSSDPCWACRGCRAREAAFMQAGKPDPLRMVRKI
jgi:7-cyano-7-deazaguanine synthase in queuosine biosynthesis